MLVFLTDGIATGGRGHWIFAGLSAGLGALAREYGLAWTVFGLCVLAWEKRLVGGGPPFLIAAAAVAAPWYLRNWALTGNPVYPPLNQWFHNPHWTVEQAALFAEKHYPPPWSWRQVAEFFRYLWRYAFDPIQPGPLLLMTTPLVLLARPGHRAAHRAGWLVMAGCIGR